MSAAEAAELPQGMHAMVESADTYSVATYDERVLRCRECGEVDTLPYVSVWERDGAVAARRWRRAGYSDVVGLLAPS